jgi:hypothetical protein
MWTVSDDEGRLRGASRMLASLLYPYDDEARTLIDGWIDELERERCIQRYSVDGAQYIVILNWLTHQKIDKPSKSRLPAPPNNSRSLAKPREHSSADLGRDQDQDLYPDRSSAGEDDMDFGSDVSPIMAKAISLAMAPKLFDDFWSAYPKRGGANPREPARKAFSDALSSGNDVDQIIGSARAYALELEKAGKLGTQYVAKAETWLLERRWGDYRPNPGDAEKQAALERDMLARGYQWIGGKWVKRETEGEAA